MIKKMRRFAWWPVMIVDRVIWLKYYTVTFQEQVPEHWTLIEVSYP